MPNPAVVIYVNQLNAKARRYAQSYQQFFARQGESIVVIESSVNRDADHQGLLAALADAQECVVIGGDGSVNIAVNALIADRKSTRLNSSHVRISYAVFCLKKKKKKKKKKSNKRQKINTRSE